MSEIGATALPTVQDRPAQGGRALMRFLGYVFMGISLGLLMYGPVTDAVSAWRQRSLRSDLPAAMAVNVPEPKMPVFEWQDWAAEDRAYWLGLPKGGIFGRLVIEKLELDSVVVKGATRETLKKGPGWIEWTSLPGPTGTAGIAGHRVTWSHPFRDIDRLAVGDTISFYSPYRVYRYRVVRIATVKPRQSDVMDDTDAPLLVLSACHPPYSAKFRLVVTSELTGVERIAPKK